MSYLTPERVPVGYSVTRARAETNYSKETLATFDQIPSQKAALILLALKFGFRDDSVSIVTEGLGPSHFTDGRSSWLMKVQRALVNGSQPLLKSASWRR
jgi:hypothetical protein